MRSTLVVLGLVVLAAGLFLWGRGDARVDAVSAPAVGARTENAGGAELMPAARSDTRAAAVQGEAASQPPAPPDDLLASLRRLGEIYVAAVEAAPGGALPEELEQELRALLEAILNDDGTVARVFALLQANDLAVRGADGAFAEKLSLAETGAFWVLVWGFGAYNGAGELDVSGAHAGGARFTADVFAALPWIRPAVAHQLARHLLLLATAEGAPILDRRFLADLLAIARARPDVAALRELLLGLAERLDELERMEILRFYLPDDDPDRLVAEIKSYLTGGASAQGIQMASLLYEQTDDDDLRSRIASAVVTTAEDPFEAAAFVTRHGDELRNDAMTLYMMGRREDSPAALDAEYELLLAADADARARGTLVRAMSRTTPDQLLSIVERDPSDEVRVAALSKATLNGKDAPSERALRMLEDLAGRSSNVTALELVMSARRLADGFRRAARPAQAAAAVDVLIALAREPSTPAPTRADALEALRTHLSEDVFAALRADLAR